MAPRWRGQMLTLREGRNDPEVLGEMIERMAATGLNLLVLEVEKGLRYESRPEVSAEGAMDRKTLRGLINRAKSLGIRCVPILPSLSHSDYLYAAHPEIQESHMAVCPRHPLTRALIADLRDELLDLFEPKWFHIGHDELLTSFRVDQRQSVLQCERCRNDDAAEWFLEDILHWRDRLRDQGVVTMMWADMLMAPSDFRHASHRHCGVHGGPPDHVSRALESAPRDIILCDWHYDPCREYPTIRYLQDKGFDVLGCPMNRESSYLFTRYAERTRSPRWLGMLGTFWQAVSPDNRERIIQLIDDNGHFFNGGDASDIRQKVETAENRRFDVGEFNHNLVFSTDELGVLETAGWKVFGSREPDKPVEALSIKSGRKGRIWVPFTTTPDGVFKRLNTEIDWEDVGPARVGLSVDDGGTYVFREPTRRIDWSNVASGHGRALLRFELTNTRPSKENCLRSIAGSGEIVERRQAVK